MREELRIVHEPLRQARHADQDQPELLAIVVVAQLLQRQVLESVRFVDDHQFDPVRGGRTDLWLPGVVILQKDAAHDGIEAPAQRLELAAEVLRGDGRRRRVDQRTALGDVAVRVGLGGRMHRDVRDDTVPVGEMPGGERLADTGRAVTDADIAFAPHGLAELREAAVFLGDQELRGDRTRVGPIH